MEFLLSEMTKYLTILFSVLYAVDGCVYFLYKTEKRRKGLYIRQRIEIFLVQFLCFCTLCFQTKDVKYVMLYGVIQVLLFAILTVTPMIYSRINGELLNHMCYLLGIGFIMISRLSFSKSVRQVLITGGGFLLALIIPVAMKRLDILKKGWILYGAGGFVLLALVYILGELTNGSKISFSIYGVTFQPSEFVKIIFIFFLASLLCEKVNAVKIAISAFAAAAYILVLAASRDLGAALIFGVAYLIVLFIATNSYLLLLGGVTVGAAGSVLVYHLFPHIQNRVLAWLDPFSYIDDVGYQITQSLFAISAGGLFGTGLFNGNPKAIPYVEDDMIFSAICEEMGILFGVILLLICFLVFFTIIHISTKIRDSFDKLICTGLAISYATQVFLTVGGGVKFIPLTGVTLPCVSYGGSSVMATVFVFFIIQGIYIKRTIKKTVRANEVEEHA